MLIYICQHCQIISMYRTAISKQDGKFYFLMNEKVKNSDFIIQPADIYLKDYKVILDKAFSGEYPSDDKNILRENKFSEKFFEELLINYQIEKQYNPNPQTADINSGLSDNILRKSRFIIQFPEIH